MYKKYRYEQAAAQPDTVQALVDMLREGASTGDFYYNIQLTRDGKLSKLCWQTRDMRDNMVRHGDCLVMDVTYKVGRLKFPLVLVAARTSKGQTCLVAAALVDSEQETTFDWILTWLFEQLPVGRDLVLFTDGDPGMAAAIDGFANVFHRQCSFHKTRNVMEKCQ